MYIYIYIISLYIAIYNNYTYSAGMKERCRDGCRTSLLIAGVVLVPNIFHTLLPPCHPYITTHFMEMIFSTCNIRNDFEPEDEECFSIRIIPVHILGRFELFSCNEDDSDASNYFCETTICIEDDDGGFLKIYF